MTKQHAVVIVGAGPTGMMLAGELALAGVDVAVVERRPSAALVGSRAGGLQARTIEVLDQRGIAERFLAAGQTMQVAGFADVKLDLTGFPTRHPYGLALWQNHIERILAAWISELPVTMYRDRSVAHVTQDAHGVDVTLATGDVLRARYVVGCDGGRSTVRKGAGIAFAGSPATTSALIAEVHVTRDPPWGIHHDARGKHGFGKLDDGVVRVMLTEDGLPTAAPTLDLVREELAKIFGDDYGAHDPVWISRFTDAARQAARYRAGRVFVAGDAAHVHSPIGGQGLNIGVQDAVNLGWKLAQVIAGTSPDSLLDTYHAERHPVGARVLRTTMASIALGRQDDRSRALSAIVTELVGMDEPRVRYAGLMSGLDVHYDLGAGHPLLGRRMPDLDLETAEGTRRVYSYLHHARPLLVDLQPRPNARTLEVTRVPMIHATYAGEWTLPVLGAVAAPAGVLVRPDGYVAWVGDVASPTLREAIARWC